MGAMQVKEVDGCRGGGRRWMDVEEENEVKEEKDGWMPRRKRG